MFDNMMKLYNVRPPEYGCCDNMGDIANRLERNIKVMQEADEKAFAEMAKNK